MSQSHLSWEAPDRQQAALAEAVELRLVRIEAKLDWLLGRKEGEGSEAGGKRSSRLPVAAVREALYLAAQALVSRLVNGAQAYVLPLP